MTAPRDVASGVWRIIRVLALAVGLIVIAGVFVRLIAPIIRKERPERIVPSPDGVYRAQLFRVAHWHDEKTWVSVGRQDNKGGDLVAIAYHDPFITPLDVKWRDAFTLVIKTPCRPPDMIRPMYWDAVSSPTRRVIIEVSPLDSKCRFGRGPLPDGGFPNPDERW